MRGACLPGARRACSSDSVSRTMTSGGKLFIVQYGERRGERGERRREVATALSALPSPLSPLLSMSFYERNLVDLAQGRRPLHHFIEARLAKEEHSFILVGFLDLRGGAPV